MSNDAEPSPPPRHDHAWFIQALRREIDRFVAALDSGPLEAAVPSCPGWSVHDLAAHVGGVHRWANHLVVTRSESSVRRKDLGIEPPREPAKIVPWVRAGGGALVAALADAPADAPVWSWVADRSAGFWARRQLHETAIHRADVELAHGRRPILDRAVALDGIDELLVLAAAIRDIGPLLCADGHDGERLHVHATDLDSDSADGGSGEWTITMADNGLRWSHEHAKGDVAVRGAASDLALVLYSRIATDDPALRVFGERGVLDHWVSTVSL